MQDSIAVQVTRGSESWQFFAFIFAAVFGLTLAILEDCTFPEAKWARIVAKASLFAGCFYLFILNHWMRNHLVDFLGWLKVEHY